MTSAQCSKLLCRKFYEHNHAHRAQTARVLDASSSLSFSSTYPPSYMSSLPGPSTLRLTASGASTTAPSPRKRKRSQVENELPAVAGMDDNEDEDETPPRKKALLEKSANVHAKGTTKKGGKGKERSLSAVGSPKNGPCKKKDDKEDEEAPPGKPPERLTPVEALADLLPHAHLLRYPIESRKRIPINSPPECLLKQLDTHPGWAPLDLEYPVFDDNYPPAFPVLGDGELIRTVFTTGENAALEWLGDAVLEAALVSGICRATPQCSMQINEDVACKLVNRRFLAHLALMYGLQLHDYVPDKRGRDTMPGMERMCDVFEALIGAVVNYFGIEYALNWLDQLLGPWIRQCTRADGCIGVQKKTRNNFETSLRHLPSTPVEIPPFPCDDAGSDESEVFSLSWAHNPGRPAVLDCRPHGWGIVDISRVSFPAEYPPIAPPLPTAAKEMMRAALTDIFYRMYHGDNIASNERLSALGQRLCKLGVTDLAHARLPTATPAELDTVRIECTDINILARLGLMLDLDRHTRVLRCAPPTTDNDTIPVLACKGAFCAFVAVIYLQLGWNEHKQWLDALFLPWVEAAADGRLRASKGAQRERENRERHASARSAPRQRYCGRIPAARQTRARVKGRLGLAGETVKNQA
ncbi:hypothetical protein MSAN_01789400 [Mycena sanguinolenta]|uniref:RNase III domain-containing protein n=1 Tax=Mycena sanguinolenta TaxID=230812 RepID=A0A8H7CS75_9AGAR|nr:hypothetical protein MSAN_01789400 [Mycena sanguinolenta]